MAEYGRENLAELVAQAVVLHRFPDLLINETTVGVTALWWASRAGKECIVPGPPRLIGQPLVVLIGHERDRLHLGLRHGKEEAVALRRDLEKPDRDDDAVLSGREEPACGHNRVVAAIFGPKHDVPDLADDLVVRASNLCAHDLVRPQPRGEFFNGDERLGPFLVAAASGCAALNLRLARSDLLFGLLLVIVAQAAHRGPCNQFADVGQEALAIGVPPVGPERKGSVPQAAQVAHALAMRGPAKLRLLQDRFFELGISDLAVRHGLCGAERAEESDREEKSCRVHRWSDLWGSVSVGQWADNVILPLARSRAASRVQWVSAAIKRVETAVMI